MLVRDCMTRHPIMISPTWSVSDAERLMSENGIRHLPVVGDGKRLLGLITRQRLAVKPEMLGSLNVWEISRYLSDLKVNKVMLRRKAVVTVDAERSVERAAAMMNQHRIGCLPVVDEDDAVVGIVTKTDLLQALQEMLGLPAEGIRVTVRIPNRKGEFAKLMRVLLEKEWGVMGIGTFPARKDPGAYNVVVKIPGVTVEEVQSALATVPDHRIVDIRSVV